MTHRIEVLENNAVSIFKDDEPVAIIHQPTWPDGTEWASAEESTIWAENFVRTLEEGIPFSPNGPF